MNKRKLLHRIILTLVGAPVLLAAIVFFPQYNHALFFLLALFFSAAGSLEIKGLLEQKFSLRITVSPLLGLIFPLTAYISLFFSLSFSALWAVFILFMLLIFAIEIIRGSRDDYEHSFPRSVMTLFMVFYPNLLIPFVIFIVSFEHSSFLLMLFFLMVFSNDVFSYVFGMAFGRSTRGIVKASPNKSLIGYAGGALMTVAVAFGYSVLFSGNLPASTWWHMGILGLIMSLAANIGDLFESVIKRSVDVKDSGSIVPGRGGILDSIDSIIFSAPVFYYLVLLWYLVT